MADNGRVCKGACLDGACGWKESLLCLNSHDAVNNTVSAGSKDPDQHCSVALDFMRASYSQ